MSADWITPDWPAPASVGALVTTRDGGFSGGPYAGMNLALHVGDVPETVLRNRALLRARLPAEPLWLEQVHGVAVADADRASGVPHADASIARHPGRVCVVMTADCLPVLFCDEGGTVVAAAHAGWRGLADGVLEAAVARMAISTPTILAWLGPAIGPDAFEVGSEVRQRFVDDDPLAAEDFRRGLAPDKWMADLFGLARRRLARIGVTRVHGGGICTHAGYRRFFSYRRAGITGRFASMVWLRG